MRFLLGPSRSGVPIVPGAIPRPHEKEFAIPGCGISTKLTPLKIFEYFEMAS
jgi:hypothetical protein